VRQETAPNRITARLSIPSGSERLCRKRSPPSLRKLPRLGGQIWNLIGLIGGAMTAVSPHSSVFLAGKMGSVK